MRDVQETLDRHTPEPARMSDWDAVLRDARPRRRSPFLQLGLATGVVGLAALFVVAPWKGAERVGILDRALAAVGDQPVLHILLEHSARGDEVVDLESGRPVVRKLTTEVWFDDSRGLKKTISRIDGAPLDEMLETPQGGFTEGGVIYTCAWIAEHPVEAAKARVSCPGGSDSRRASGAQRVSLDPALASFVDHYRAALASGEARRIRDGQVDGHAVTWIAFRIKEPGRSASTPTFERVAIDKDTYKPLLISTDSESVRVRDIETVPFDERLFSRPRRVERPSVGNVVAESDLKIGAAGTTLPGGNALWLGEEWQGLHLASVKRQELSTGYGPFSTREPSRAVGVELEYSQGVLPAAAGSHAAVIVREATSCPFAYAWSCGAGDPKEGTIELGEGRSLLRIGGLFVTIWDFRAARQPSTLQLARSLQPVPGTSGGSGGGG
jgi:hypothetical protein